jgi:hypothetical protein
VWGHLEAVQRGPNLITVQDLMLAGTGGADGGGGGANARERLETRDRLVRVALGHGRLVAATTQQLYIFRLLVEHLRKAAKNWLKFT